ncbi:hypothetical protein [Teredinibacter turnerae]|uniref:Uncharacterized protein n=1 Tax=Teredinibacter turnerae (strain ATCC 39867 / T7901) TaxID=377629 RepID=C5BSN2_TERTT|nr:hypothetical protein TERTU_1430 [Teredinibacter turnerae T7901]
MGEILKYSKIWFYTNLIFRGAGALSLLAMAAAIAFGDGGTFSISWEPIQ